MIIGSPKITKRIEPTPRRGQVTTHPKGTETEKRQADAKDQDNTQKIYWKTIERVIQERRRGPTPKVIVDDLLSGVAQRVLQYDSP